MDVRARTSREPTGCQSPAGLSGVTSARAVLPGSLAPVSRPSRVYGWGFSRAMKIPQVHTSGITGRGVKVAVLDTGIAPHPALNVRGGFNSTDREDPARWQDTHWHGTHVAGILAATGGGNGLMGVAPECELYAVRVGRVTDPSLTRFDNFSFEADLIEGLTWCLENGIEVVNMSLFSQPSPALDALIAEAWARGMVLVAPSGNGRSGGAEGVDYPARHPQVIAVGAVGRLGIYPESSYFAQAEQAAVFSQPFPDYFVPGFSKGGPGLDFVAPGVAILSTVPAQLRGWDERDQGLVGYTAWMGTSQAAPFISGLAALILECHPELRALTDGRRVEGVKAVLSRSAVDLGLPSERQGAGMPFAPACLEPGAETA